MKETIEANVTTANTLPEVIEAVPLGFTVLRWGNGFAVIEPTPTTDAAERTA